MVGLNWTPNGTPPFFLGGGGRGWGSGAMDTWSLFCNLPFSVDHLGPQGATPQKESTRINGLSVGFPYNMVVVGKHLTFLLIAV